MKMVSKTAKGVLASLVAVGLSQLAAVTPAAAQDQCMTYVHQLCWGYWDELGYASVKDCHLQEYARCVEGGPPPAGDPYVGLAVRQTVKAD